MLALMLRGLVDLVALINSFCNSTYVQAALETPQRISKTTAIALASTNLEKLLGLQSSLQQADYVATSNGDILDFESKVVAVIAGAMGVVDLF